jgi:catechol 2,3-dioxygenase-like lactoylglutathione lyase family enzyme
MKLLKGCLPLIIFAQVACAQVVVEFPKDRMVIQRSLSNTGEILVAGFSERPADNVRVRFLPYADQTGTATGWRDCRVFDKEGKTNFYLKQTVSAGWYKMQVKSFKGGVLKDSTTVSRVGVGEVFVIAGQSNAQGQSENGSLKSNDPYERVSIILGHDDQLNNAPSFDYMNLESHFPIYPLGSSSWCWGELGDLLVQRLNVPVMFFNAAWGGTSSENWVQSIGSLSQKEVFRGEIPYHVLKRTLQFYRHTLGFRAVLWHQGEADTYQSSFETSLPRIDYFENIKRVISTSRDQVVDALPWMVSRASYIYGLKDSLVLDDQKRLSVEVENVFAGPYTDTLTNARFDGVHFTNNYGKNGLSKLANSWNKALDASFFETAPPLLPDFDKVSFVLEDGSVSKPTGYQSASWGGGGNSFGFLTDQLGNVYVSPLLLCGERKHKMSKLSKQDSFNAVTESMIGKELTLDYKIGASSAVIKASGFIILRPGFEVEPTTTTFLAEIGGCY